MTTTTLPELILALLAGDEMDGLAMAEWIRSGQQRDLTPYGTVWATLDRMVADGTLSVRWDDDEADPEHPYPRRRLYRRASGDGAQMSRTP